jgi:hypothetical protein
MDIKVTTVLRISRPQFSVCVHYVQCIHTVIWVHPFGSNRIVPGPPPLRLFVYMIDCMNNVRDESYEGSCFVCNNSSWNLWQTSQMWQRLLSSLVLFTSRECVVIRNIRCVCGYVYPKNDVLNFVFVCSLRINLVFSVKMVNYQWLMLLN